MAMAQAYSNYKYHNTIKFLIGSTPQGLISYVSRAGAIWDSQHLLPGDQIIANRGFNVADSVGLYCAEIKILPFTKGKTANVTNESGLITTTVLSTNTCGSCKLEYYVKSTLFENL